MDNITIPPEALKAAKRDAAVAIYRLVAPDTRAHELTKNEIKEIARTACLAMLEAWPGMSRKTSIQGFVTAITVEEDAIILPLTENTND